MPWLFVLIAGAFEVVWLFTLKQSQGFTRLWPSVVTVLAMAASFYFLSQSLRALPVGTAYAVWTGIGAVGAAVAGILIYDEPRTIPRLVSIALIVAGIVGLKLSAR